MPTTVLTFWVLIAIGPSQNTAMLSQQFLSQSACEEAKQYVEDHRGGSSYTSAKCIKDTILPAAQAASSSERNKSGKKP